MKLACLMLSTFFAVSALAQTPAAPQKTTETSKQPEPPPNKRLFIADYVIGGAVGSAHTDTSGNTYGSAVATGRNISLEATDGFMSHAKVKVSNLVKDVCGYIQAHP
jgi:hypothetical protein